MKAFRRSSWWDQPSPWLTVILVVIIGAVIGGGVAVSALLFVRRRGRADVPTAVPQPLPSTPAS